MDAVVETGRMRDAERGLVVVAGVAAAAAHVPLRGLRFAGGEVGLPADCARGWGGLRGGA